MFFQRPVLVVDDDVAVCMFMQHVLETHAYRVLTAHSGGEALKMIRNHGRELRLLVTDVLMPDMNGPSLAQAAERLFPGLPVLYVSGYVGDERDHMEERAWLEKPFTISQLLERVKALALPDPSPRPSISSRDEIGTSAEIGISSR
jgi:two-component system cell cycle sensor histidine kinase/response regulator CckA